MVHNGTMREIEDSMQDLIWNLYEAYKKDERYFHTLCEVKRIDKELGEIFRRLRAQESARAMGHGQTESVATL